MDDVAYDNMSRQSPGLFIFNPSGVGARGSNSLRDPSCSFCLGGKTP